MLPQVFKIPELRRQDENVGVGGELDFDMVPANELTEVATVTRRELSVALVTRFYGRVWDDNAADPSFFKDATVMLTPPFHEGKHLDMLRLVKGDESALPTTSSAVVPTPATVVEDRRRSTWAEIRTRAIVADKAHAAAAEEKSLIHEAKRRKTSSPDRPSPEPPRKGESQWAALGISRNHGSEKPSESLVVEKISCGVLTKRSSASRR